MKKLFIIFFSACMIYTPAIAKKPSKKACEKLPRTCSKMTSCKQAKKALACGNKKLDRDRDGVPCESLCS